MRERERERKMPRENEMAKVWWKKNLEKLRTEIHRLFNKIKSNNTCETYKSKPTQYNKEIRMAKRDSWRKFSEELQELYPESSSQGKQYCGRSGFLQKSRWSLHNHPQEEHYGTIKTSFSVRENPEECSWTSRTRSKAE